MIAFAYQYLLSFSYYLIDCFPLGSGWRWSTMTPRRPCIRQPSTRRPMASISSRYRCRRSRPLPSTLTSSFAAVPFFSLCLFLLLLLLCPLLLLLGSFFRSSRYDLRFIAAGANAFDSKSGLYYVALQDSGGDNYMVTIDTKAKKSLAVVAVDYFPYAFVLWAL